MNKAILFLLFCALVCSCGRKQANKEQALKSEEPTPTQPSTPVEPTPPSPGEPIIPTPEPTPDNEDYFACYPGITEELCFLTTSAEDITSEHYHYPDPIQDSSFPEHFNPDNYIAPIRLLPLSDEYNPLKLTENFNYEELFPLHKGPYALASKIALNHLQQIRTNLDKIIHPTSVFRSPNYNQQVGGATWSRHMYGDAFDFFAPEAELNELKELCEAQQASFIQVYENHIHCDWRDEIKDSSFYPVEQVPTLSAQTLNEIRIKRYKDMAKDTQIKHALIQSNGEHTLSLDFPFKEDGEKLKIKWLIKKKNQRHIVYADQISLTKGKYKIEVTVGETVKKKFNYKVP